MVLTTNTNILFKEKKINYKQQFQNCLYNELKYFDFRYKIGLNKDTIPFYPLYSCTQDGLYFTTNKDINKFLDY
jgi:hypothetical protein